MCDLEKSDMANVAIQYFPTPMRSVLTRCCCVRHFGAFSARGVNYSRTFGMKMGVDIGGVCPFCRCKLLIVQLPHSWYIVLGVMVDSSDVGEGGR